MTVQVPRVQVQHSFGQAPQVPPAGGWWLASDGRWYPPQEGSSPSSGGSGSSTLVVGVVALVIVVLLAAVGFVVTRGGEAEAEEGASASTEPGSGGEAGSEPGAGSESGSEGPVVVEPSGGPIDGGGGLGDSPGVPQVPSQPQPQPQQPQPQPQSQPQMPAPQSPGGQVAVFEGRVEGDLAHGFEVSIDLDTGEVSGVATWADGTFVLAGGLLDDGSIGWADDAPEQSGGELARGLYLVTSVDEVSGSISGLFFLDGSDLTYDFTATIG